LALVARKLLAVPANLSFSEKLGPSMIFIPSGFMTSPVAASRTKPISSRSTPDINLSELETFAIQSF
jgi:hypothetical protein